MPIDLRNKVAITEVGTTRFGEPYQSSAEPLICEATSEAFGLVGATGVRLLYEPTQEAELGLAHDLGGPAAVSCVSILGNAR